MQAARVQRPTAEDYFAIDEADAYKCEYYHGEIFAMSGGTPNHSRLSVNLIRLMGNAFLGGPCEVFTSDLRVQIDEGLHYTYPDVSVGCEGAQFDAHHNLLNPVLVVEVLSPSTEAYDRGKKMLAYQAVPSLKCYVLVAQDDREVQVFTRCDDGGWLHHAYTDPEGVVRLPAVGCEVSMAELYRNVEIDPEASRRQLRERLSQR